MCKMSVIFVAELNIKDKDYATGGRKCAELAFVIHREIGHRGLYGELRKRERFDWTHSPEVSERALHLTKLSLLIC